MNKIVKQLLIAVILTLVIGLLLPFSAENNQLVAKPIGRLPDPILITYFFAIIFLIQLTRYTKPQLGTPAEIKLKLVKLFKDPNVISILASFVLFIAAIFILPHSILGLLPLYSGVFILMLSQNDFNFTKALKIFIFTLLSTAITIGIKYLSIS